MLEIILEKMSSIPVSVLSETPVSINREHVVC